jgi:hypothetical protein
VDGYAARSAQTFALMKRRRVPSWLVQLTWFIAGVFGTGAFWYYLSQKNDLLIYVSAAGALAFVFIAITLHVLGESNGGHRISARAVPVETSTGKYSLHVTVSNSGDQPISITHVLLRPPGSPGVWVNFASSGQVRLDVGERKSANIDAVSVPINWQSVDELRSFDVFVQDALGKNHKAVWEGGK